MPATDQAGSRREPQVPGVPAQPTTSTNPFDRIDQVHMKSMACLKDFDQYPCICDPHALLHQGCRCGAFTAAQADLRAHERRLAWEAEQERNKQRDFLIKAPTPPITFKTLCPFCKHDIAKHDLNDMLQFHCPECDEVCL